MKSKNLANSSVFVRVCPRPVCHLIFCCLLLAGCQAAQLADAPLVTTVESRLGVDVGALIGDETAVPPSLATAYAAATAVSRPAAELEPGSSRRNPLPATTELITRNDWEVVVLEQLRGEAAWEQIRAANSNNQPPPTGEEYLLLKLWVKNNSSDLDEQSLGLHVTGNALKTHYSFDSDVVEPDPQLDTYLPGNSESIGWEAYRIQRDEGNLMLMLDDWSDYEAGYLYVALSPGAAIAVPEALTGVEKTAVGITPNDPAPFGQMVTSDDWQARVAEVVTGDDAWQLVYDANQFNDPPPAGHSYLAVKLWLRYIGLVEGPHYTTDDLFTIVGSTVAQPSVVDPEPEMRFELFPGGEAEGWLVWLVADNEANTLLRFSTPDGERYLSLVVSGR
ncbi:MAG: hypothetical protein KDE56_05980 [Anaerolineales bacterium]|nr:hypothetical protein [Anaerolineales bacterium]